MNGIKQSVTSGSAPGHAGRFAYADMLRLGETFSGRIDEFTVYGESLTDAEIVAIFNAGSAGKTQPANSDPELAIPLNDLEVNEDAEDTVISLSEVFEDADGDKLILSAMSSDESLATAVVSGTELRLHYLENQHGPVTITVTASDGTTSASALFTVTVLPVNDPPIAHASVAVFELAENSSNGTLVGYVSASDVDGEILVFIETSGQTAFAIDSITGEITVADRTQLVFEESPVFTLTIEVSDGALVDSATIAVNLLDVVGVVDGLLAFWPAEGNALDTIGNHDGTPLGNTAFVSGKVDLAFDFDGTDGTRVDIPSAATLTLQQLTADTWIYPRSIGVPGDLAGGTIISASGTTLAPYGIYGPGSDGRYLFQIGNSDGTSTSVFTNDAFALNAWHHLAMTWDGVTLRAFVDGDEQGSVTTSGKTIGYNGFDRLSIGEWPPQYQTLYGLDRRFDGRIDEIRMYDRALSASEVSVNYLSRSEPPVINDQVFAVDENSASGTSLGIITAIDPDSDTLTFLETSGQNAFAVNPTTGEITVVDSQQLDYELMPTFLLEVQVTDGQLSAAANVAINLNDVVEPGIPPQFFVSPGNNISGDVNYQQSLPTGFVELDFNTYPHGSKPDLFYAGRTALDVRILDASGSVISDRPSIAQYGSSTPATPQAISDKFLLSGDFNVFGPAIEINFSAPVTGFGGWIFDDSTESDDVFILSVTEVGGAEWTSPILSANNGFGHAVEGFLGVSSTIGIERVVVRSLRNGTSLPGWAFELDHLQIGQPLSSNENPEFYYVGGPTPLLGSGFSSTAPSGVSTIDFEQYAHFQTIDAFAVGSVSVAVDLLDSQEIILPFDATVFQYGSSTPVVPGTLEGKILLAGNFTAGANGRFLRMTFSQPIDAFGTWLFDDGTGLSGGMQLIATTTDGSRIESEVLDSGNGLPHIVEGFLGVTAPSGIRSVMIKNVDIDGTHTYIPPMEFDNIFFGNPVASANPPIAVDDNYDVLEDDSLVVPAPGLLLNDSDLDGNDLLVDPNPISAPQHGTVLLQANGGFTYTPGADYSGIDQFTYKITDGFGGTSSATVTISVLPVADDPVVVQPLDDRLVAEDSADLSIDLLPVFADVDGDELTLSASSSDSSIVNAQIVGTNLILTFAENRYGSATVTVTGSDGQAFVTDEFSVVVRSVVDAPLAVDDLLTTDEDVALTINSELLANDLDVEGAGISLVSVTQSPEAQASLIDNGDGTYTFTPQANFNGTTTISYAVESASGSSKITPNDVAPGNHFGNAIAYDGNTIVVGTMEDDTRGFNAGAAYVFINDGTNWVQQAKLTASDGASQDLFGVSVAVQGDTIVVGASWDTVGGQVQAGSAYVFNRTGTEWTQVQQLTSAAPAGFDLFGGKVVIDGTTIAVGARFDDGGAGSVFVFEKSGQLWTRTAHLVSSVRGTNNQFGISLALESDTLAVGTYWDDHSGLSNAGAVYVFERTGVGWAQQARLIASDPAADDQFGVEVAMDGDTLIIGADADDHSGLLDAGSIYVFSRQGAGWNELQKLIASDAASGSHLGLGLALDGEQIIAGAHLADQSGVVDSGSGYLFQHRNDGWTEISHTLNKSPAASQNFGLGVAFAGGSALFTAHGDDEFAVDSGAVVLRAIAIDTADVTVTINPVNDIPIASAGGPYQVFEGDSTMLNGSGSWDVDNDVLIYEWDFNYDGVTFDVDAEGVSPSFDAAGIDGPAVRAIALRVTDPTGASNIDVSEVVIENSPPQVSIEAPQTEVTEGTAITLSSTVIDPAQADTFTYSWRLTESGQLLATGNNTSFTFTPEDDGNYLVTLDVTDDDGGVESTYVYDFDSLTLGGVLGQDGWYKFGSESWNKNGWVLNDAVGPLSGSGQYLGPYPDRSGVLVRDNDANWSYSIPSYATFFAFQFDARNLDGGGHVVFENGVWWETYLLQLGLGLGQFSVGFQDAYFKVWTSSAEYTSTQAVQSTNESWKIRAEIRMEEDVDVGTISLFAQNVSQSGTMHPIDGLQNLSLGTFNRSDFDQLYVRLQTGLASPLVDNLTVLVGDPRSGAGSAEVNIVATNVSPAFDIGSDTTLWANSRGEFEFLNVAIIDPGSDIWTGTVDFGDGSGATSLNISRPNKSFDLIHAFAETGTYTTTIVLEDDDGGSFSRTVDIVVPPNVPPTFQLDFSPLHREDDGEISLTNFVSEIDPGDPAGEHQVVSLSIGAVLHPELFSALPQIDQSGTITYTLAANANGDAMVEVVATDDGPGDLSTSQYFMITVLPVNDAPTFAPGSDLFIQEDTGAQLIALWATAISTGAVNEAEQILDFEITTDNDSLFNQLPQIDATTGSLAFEVSPNSHGIVNVSVVLRDDGGIANGGVDSSALISFEIHVAAVADVPWLQVSDAVGELNAAIPLMIDAALTDADGSETLAIIISGMPAGAMLSAGNINQDGVWTLTPSELPGLMLIPAENDSADFSLQVSAVAQELSNGDLAVTGPMLLEVVILDATEPVVVEPTDRGQLIAGGNGGSDVVQVVVSLSDAVSASVEADFDAYAIHLAQGFSATPFQLVTLGITLVDFEQLEKLLEFGTFRGVYENPIVGNNSSQTLVGTDNADLIVGYGGNDTLIGDVAINGAGGNDIFIGGSGNDAFDGGAGDDVMLFDGAANGFDTFHGGTGYDRAIAVAVNTIIGVNGYDNGVESIEGQGDTIVRDTSSSRVLNFSETALHGIQEIDAGGGNDTVAASNLSAGAYRGGAGNDLLVAGDSTTTWLYEGNANGFDAFQHGGGVSSAIAEAAGTIIGVDGFAMGVDRFVGVGDTIIRDTSSSRTLDFSSTELVGIAEIDAGGGNDVLFASSLSAGTYRGNAGNDILSAGSADVVWLYEGTNEGFDTLINGTGNSQLNALSLGTVIGVNGFENGADRILGIGDTIVRDTSSSRVLDFANTELIGVIEIDAGGGNDTVTASNMSGASYRGGSGNDVLISGDAATTWLYEGDANGYDSFQRGVGVVVAIVEGPGTVIGINGYENGVNEFLGLGDTVIQDTSSSRTLDFSLTALSGISQVDASGGNDTIVASSISAGAYRGGAGNDLLIAGESSVTWLYEGSQNGFDSFHNGSGNSIALAESLLTAIGVNGYTNGVDQVTGLGDTLVLDSSSSHVLDFSQTVVIGVAGLVGGSGNDVITASDSSDGSYSGNGGNDTLIALSSEAVWLYDSGSNGFDTFVNGSGQSTANATELGVIIGVNGYENGVDAFNGMSDTIIADSSSSHLLDFSMTELNGILAIDAGGGNDTIVTSTLSSATYLGGGGRDTFVVKDASAPIEITIADFSTLEHDLIDLSDFGFDPTSAFGDFQFEQIGNDTVVELSPNVRIRLTDVALAEIAEEWFLF